ncbi:MAG: Uncharacterised protein [Flavobacteriia bacterium]|nr:MAG: Uncharacterised protein [Flavobacteriia bacterium]
MVNDTGGLMLAEPLTVQLLTLLTEEKRAEADPEVVPV